ncbi:UDP-N-acetylglucosamine 1-carboxyvinyltransferase [Candidatus Riesia pediculicola]|nr:UDP-N-acetylglucosamine 1-carboxyvinyltransferase [Candidatus Riesia pediculicola]ARC53576.1 UDP-N-acetylglucosamine 1-carboxyvinyltransferase [Candidatus Riesia pediculicola]QOJ86231.1 UDP-N-acetylglucosamine 1-carboxyvinyltransferase [Candidatus Riesia pediculicola]
MNTFQLNGPTKLTGKVFISGSKNSALPILFASLLSDNSVILYNIPKINDVNIAIKILNHIGVKVSQRERHIFIDTDNMNNFSVPYELSKSIRASILILAPLISRFGRGNIFFPGGCHIGERPIDLHIEGLKRMGINIEIKKKKLTAYIKKKLIGTEIFINKVSVGATISILMAATKAKGRTIIKNAACEPEIVDISNFLNLMGAKIKGAGTKEIRIEGVKILKGGEYKILPDRIETGTFLIAAAISKGSIVCKKTDPTLLKDVLFKLRQTGLDVQEGKNWIKLDTHEKRPKAISFKTEPYPGFPTDMQSQFTLLNSIASGRSVVTETIFKNRFMFIPDLIRMGAKICRKGNQIFCKGVKRLVGKRVFAQDLRGAASLVLAGCIADGKTTVHNVLHIDRGYENMEKKLRSLGAIIKKRSFFEK